LAQGNTIWKEGMKKKEKREENERKGLTLTGLLMEGLRTDCLDEAKKIQSTIMSLHYFNE
jgi:hypothetical protein